VSPNTVHEPVSVDMICRLNTKPHEPMKDVGENRSDRPMIGLCSPGRVNRNRDEPDVIMKYLNLEGCTQQSMEDRL